LDVCLCFVFVFNVLFFVVVGGGGGDTGVRGNTLLTEEGY